MTVRTAYDFGATRKSARRSLALLAAGVSAADLPEAVRSAIAGGMRRDEIVRAVQAVKTTPEVATDLARALGEPLTYTSRERHEVACWIARHHGDHSAWVEPLPMFPLRSAPSLGGFAAARIAVAKRPGEPELVRELRDEARAVGAQATLAALVETGWLDPMVFEPGTLAALHALDWAAHGVAKIDFARRVASKRAILAASGGDAAHLAAIIDLATGRPRRAREGLAAFLPQAAPPYLLACCRLDGRDGAQALESVDQRAIFEFVLRHARLAAFTRAPVVLAAAANLPVPPATDPLRADYILALARAVEVGRPSEADRLALDHYLADVPAWRELLPPADATWQRASRALVGENVTPPGVAAALQDLLLVEPRASWFVAVADRLLERKRWLVDGFGEATALGIQVHALVGHAVALVQANRLSDAQRQSLDGLDVLAALQAARSLAANQPHLVEGEL